MSSKVAILGRDDNVVAAWLCASVCCGGRRALPGCRRRERRARGGAQVRSIAAGVPAWDIAPGGPVAALAARGRRRVVRRLDPLLVLHLSADWPGASTALLSGTSSRSWWGTCSIRRSHRFLCTTARRDAYNILRTCGRCWWVPVALVAALAVVAVLDSIRRRRARDLGYDLLCWRRDGITSGALADGADRYCPRSLVAAAMWSSVQRTRSRAARSSREIFRDPFSRLHTNQLVDDDDPRKRRRLHRIRVCGTTRAARPRSRASPGQLLDGDSSLFGGGASGWMVQWRARRRPVGALCRAP